MSSVKPKLLPTHSLLREYIRRVNMEESPFHANKTIRENWERRNNELAAEIDRRIPNTSECCGHAHTTRYCGHKFTDGSVCLCDEPSDLPDDINSEENLKRRAKGLGPETALGPVERCTLGFDKESETQPRVRVFEEKASASDWDLIYRPNPNGPPPIEGGAVTASTLLDVVQHPEQYTNNTLWKVVQRLAQEVVRHRWQVCEDGQGGE